MMDTQTIQRYGDELYASLLSRIPVEPLTNREPGITIDDAYQIQLRMVQRRLGAGEVVIGKKIGVTSQVVMDMLEGRTEDQKRAVIEKVTAKDLGR